MRTTIDISDILMREIQDRASRGSSTIKDEVNRALEKGLGLSAADRPTWKAKAYSLGAPSVDLEKAWYLAEDLETDAINGKRELRK
jgi:hypothetical protein